MAMFHSNQGLNFSSKSLNEWNIESDVVSHGEEISSITKSDVELTRTALLLLDYKQFLAARTIQRHWRGFYSRLMWERRNRAATIIQAAWRGYWVRKNFLKFVENKLQAKVLKHYHDSATKIQALLRGWYTRQTVHDSSALKRMQYCAAEDLLFCVALKLHHLMRTDSIPGVYSLRHSKCLSRVEKLLSTTNYRYHNARVQSLIIRQEVLRNAQRKEFKESKFKVSVPFPGPDDKMICKPHCETYLANTKDINRRMFKIIQNYEETMRNEWLKRPKYSKAEKRRRKRIETVLKAHGGRDFCGDVIASMRRWDIWKITGIHVDKDIFRNTELLERFLDDAFEILSSLNNCHCQMPVMDEPFCH